MLMIFLSLFSPICRLAESRDELDEFQENSRELEAELEAQLEQQEARVKDLTSRLARVQTENDQIKVSTVTLEYLCSV